MNPLLATYKKLPAPIQALIILIGVIIAIVILKKLAESLSGIKQRINSEIEENKFEKAGEELSYPKTAYVSMADSLEQSMAGIGMYPLDFTRVMAKVRNNLDFIELRQAFGIRKGETMQQWIDGQWQYMSTIKPIINEAWAKRGIKYTI